MKKIIFLLLTVIIGLYSYAQLPGNKEIHINLKDENNLPVHSATVILLSIDSVMLKTTTTDKSGTALFKNLDTDKYKVQITHTGFESVFLSAIDFKTESVIKQDIILKQTAATLKDVTVTAKKQFVQFAPDKTIINVDAGIGNAGATVMDVLERSPGITVGRDGTISMKGKPQVMVLIDGKQTQLGGADLQAYLSGMNASQVDVIELIDNPGAKYDAAGNAGIINIKTKKNRQKGFNGSLSVSLGQGIYTKNNNSFSINYRTGKFNLYANYGARLGKERMKLYALRKYFDKNGVDSLLLEQPNVTNTKISSHNIKTGVDFFASEKTTLGLAFTGNLTTRNSNSLSTIDWMSPSFVIDSTISTKGTRYSQFKRAGVNFNVNHKINSSSEIITDIDFIKFSIDGNQYFETQLDAPGSIAQATRGNIPSDLEIFTAKVDYSKKFSQFVWEAGLKTANTKTDNLAQYYYNDGASWYDDLSRSNHFLYDEKIHSAYSSIDADHGKWHWQAGLRYELTSYKANQLGNTVVKDSSFKKTMEVYSRQPLFLLMQTAAIISHFALAEELTDHNFKA
ncbi:MAG: outer membrane beta-barrel protein [Chitinophagaceae bacterium]|nr:outer membrane beta-barrel protein [Chitinophagaceae bacterium]